MSPGSPFESAISLAARIGRGETTSRAAVEECLARIERLNPGIGAFVRVDAEGALAAADVADRCPPGQRGQFHGVPIAVKDNADTAGLTTSYGSRAFADHVPESDAGIVTRLREAGFILIGKTNTPEFGTQATTESVLAGPCRNPWRPSLNAGGSSGGTAAAVAAGLVPLAHGTDGGGSLRIPAACCGVPALKPSRGRISWGPRFPEFLASFATHGFVARDLADLEAVTNAVSAPHPGDPYWLGPLSARPARRPSSLRVAFSTAAPSGAPVDPSYAGTVAVVVGKLVELGHRVEEAAPEWRAEEIAPDLGLVTAAAVARYGQLDRNMIEPANRDLLRLSEATTSADYVRALDRLHRHGARIARFWEEHDVLLTPVVAQPPPPVGWLTGELDQRTRAERMAAFAPFTAFANLTGQPAVALPLGEAPDGLPIGLQLVAAARGERLLLDLAAQMEPHFPWSERTPSVG